MVERNPQPGIGGERYVPYEERGGNESIVYFTRDLSAEGLRRAYEQVSGNVAGKVAVKLHTGEQHGPNIIPRPWVAGLLETDLPDATIVETNSYYAGDRDTTEKHRATLEVNHTKGGFGGSAKNIGIGCADGKIGKKEIHTTPGSDDMWDISDEEFMERMMESAKAVCDHFGERITFDHLRERDA